MKQINTVVFRKKLTSLLDEVFFHGARYEIMKCGKKRAVIMSSSEYEQLVEYIRDRDEERMKK